MTAALCVSGIGVAAAAASGVVSGSSLAWWVWLVLLFGFTFAIGMIAVVSGVGGGVLFVPIVGGFFPFHLDFVRGAGLMVALAGALSAGPGLLRLGLANLRLALPAALVGSISSVFGAIVGLLLPADQIQIALGVAITAISVFMILSRRAEFPNVAEPDFLSRALGINGRYYEESLQKTVLWQTHRTPLALLLFVGIGFMGGMFGLGAGWANVPVLNLVLGAPLKVAVATSGVILAVNGTAAAWVYLNKGAVLALITIPSVAGIMIGTRIGVRILSRAKVRSVRITVIAILLLSGIRSLLKGLGLWG